MVGLGFGAILVTTILALISSVATSEHAVVTLVSFAFRAIGSSTGITVASAVFQNTPTKGLYRRLDYGEEIDELIERIRRNLDAIWKLDLQTRIFCLGRLHVVFQIRLWLYCGYERTQQKKKWGCVHSNCHF